MSDRPPASTPIDPSSGAFRIAGLYLLIGGLWILFSDQVAAAIAHDTMGLTLLSTLKGWGFILVTALLLYWLIRRDTSTLRQSEAKFATAFRTSPDAITISRLSDGLYLEINDSFTTLTGYTAQDVVGKTSFELNLWVSPAERELLVAGLREHGEVLNLEASFRLKNGQIGTGLMSARFVRINEEPCILAITHDITERKQMETALYEQVAALQTLNEIDHEIMAAADPPHILDLVCRRAAELAHAPKALVFIQTAPDSVDLTASCGLGDPGAAREELARQWQAGVLHPGLLGIGETIAKSDFSAQAAHLPEFQAREGIRAFLLAPLSRRERIVGGLVVLDTVPHSWSADEIRILGMLASQSAIALDKAGLYQALQEQHGRLQESQRRLIQAEKMTALGRLVASIAHEINNPLQAIMGSMTLAQEELEKAQIRRGRLVHYLDMSHEEIQRIVAMVQRLRDFYRPAGREMQPTDVRAVLESVLDLTAKQLQDNHVAVECAWAESLPPVLANPDHLRQVFMNLIINAIDAMTGRQGGTLGVRAALDQMPKPDSPDLVAAVRVEISDTGEGIPANVVSRIFEPFTTTKKQGTGLGLAISYEIIQAHSGQITVASQEGAGSTFTICLPAMEQQVMGYSAPAQDKSGSGP